MKTIKNKFTSGTGNGLSEDQYSNLIEALDNLSLLIKQFKDNYTKKKGNLSFNDLHWLNNWQGEYRMDISFHDENFPFQLVNGVGFDSWGDIEMSITLPVKMKAPTFDGGTTDKMALVFRTEIGYREMEDMVKDNRLPSVLKRIVLEKAREYITQRINEREKEENRQRVAFIDAAIRKYESALVEKQEFESSIDALKRELQKISQYIN